MTKVRENIEKTFEDIAYAEAGEYKPHHRKVKETDSLEDVLTAIGMAEGGDEEFAKRLHPLFHRKHRRN